MTRRPAVRKFSACPAKSSSNVDTDVTALPSLAWTLLSKTTDHNVHGPLALLPVCLRSTGLMSAPESTGPAGGTGRGADGCGNTRDGAGCGIDSAGCGGSAVAAAEATRCVDSSESCSSPSVGMQNVWNAAYL